MSPLSLLFFSNLFIFNCRTVALQYCAGFCLTSTQISHRYTHVRLLNLPPISHPFTLLGCHRVYQFELNIANSCVIQQFPLAILHMVMIVFPCYSLNLSHLSFCALCWRCLCCPINRFISTIFLDSKNMR